jgi:hypothetical protein
VLCSRQTCVLVLAKRAVTGFACAFAMLGTMQDHPKDTYWYTRGFCPGLAPVTSTASSCNLGSFTNSDGSSDGLSNSSSEVNNTTPTKMDSWLWFSNETTNENIVPHHPGDPVRSPPRPLSARVLRWTVSASLCAYPFRALHALTLSHTWMSDRSSS